MTETDKQVTVTDYAPTRYRILARACTLGCLVSSAMVVTCLVISAKALNRIIKTTPFLGILVDDEGNPVPIEGHEQLWFGVVGLLLFSILALVLFICGQRTAGYRRYVPDESQRPA